MRRPKWTRSKATGSGGVNWPALLAALSAGIQVVAGYTARPTTWQVICLIGTLVLAVAAALDFKKPVVEVHPKLDRFKKWELAKEPLAPLRAKGAAEDVQRSA